ncbi:hypothetical protein BC351_24205 [Paenibacillus ferrarius]|uniref:Uncharacterized protein n=1 Tax=Paenibacillus ferrarius TaxID=1469647 RepID=A0A1V4HN75_9BACL|nr:hypothetical protein BC351_24205 [Paenibacillus ferrarius]
MQEFSAKWREKWEFLQMCRNFSVFQPLVCIMLQKDAQLQEFTDFGLNQVQKDAYLQEYFARRGERRQEARLSVADLPAGC